MESPTRLIIGLLLLSTVLLIAFAVLWRPLESLETSFQNRSIGMETLPPYTARFVDAEEGLEGNRATGETRDTSNLPAFFYSPEALQAPPPIYSPE